MHPPTLAHLALLTLTHPLLATSLPSSSPDSSLLSPVTSLLSSLGNAPPPQILQTADPSPECAALNGGALQCCDGSLAGDVPPVLLLAKLFGYALNPNDVNGVLCNDDVKTCPGVRMCCQVTALSPLVSLYCQDYQKH
ncbi:hypothetical protein F5B20DRAFT_578179 [Whalleya microplaca]|nr:hypothetical protein F5B20DRAFT_578179 [Whalleya microplaca]